VETAIQLRQLTSLRVGGTPLCYFRPVDKPELLEVLGECRRRALPWRVLGGGTNLLVDEGVLPYAVIHIAAPGFSFVERTGRGLCVGAGTQTSELLGYCRREGLGGLEFLSALPGTVGGAVAGNAGAWGQEICSRLTRAWIVTPDGREVLMHRSSLSFSYRCSNLQGAVVTAVELEVEPRDAELVALQMAEYARRRVGRHPMALPSAGCVFKNPPGASAGKLLDMCGMKGVRVGGAQVSASHANFVINDGTATARDVIGLIRLMRQQVRRRFGIELELEVRHWPSRSMVA
jgi:UDP-N-acetylmuramate dehydrogenase